GTERLFCSKRCRNRHRYVTVVKPFLVAAKKEHRPAGPIHVRMGLSPAEYRRFKAENPKRWTPTAALDRLQRDPYADWGVVYCEETGGTGVCHLSALDSTPIKGGK